MAYIVILAGIPASGKTTFSKHLSKELGIPVISKDFIKEFLYDGLGFHSREEKVKLGIVSKDIMYGMAEECMKLGLTVILENNFETYSKPKLIELIQTYGYKPLTIRFEGDLTAIYERFLKRELSDERHLGHVTNECYPPKGPCNRESKITLDEFGQSLMSRGMLDFDIGGEIIHVDTTDLNKLNYYAISDQVKDIIKNK